jgi:hyaluronan synthase
MNSIVSDQIIAHGAAAGKTALRPPWIKEAPLKLAIAAATIGVIALASTLSANQQVGAFKQIDAFWSHLAPVARVFGLIVLFAFVVRTIIWLFYKPFSYKGGPLPRLTVVIPAYNEGEMVEKSILSIVAADYPRELLEVIAVDDGSKDDTWSYIEGARLQHPGVVRSVRLDRNCGKRAALYTGFKAARGEIILTMDSDSVVANETLKNMVAPFIADARIGAVAGNVKVLNRNDNFLTRMLWVRFVMAFDYTRAYQSVCRTVTCCPGALTAYRASALQTVVEAWMNQQFLGVSCTYGEDRAMTNYILNAGYDAVYQRNALVYTVVPQTFKGLSRMYTRWARSNIRESLIFGKQIFTSERKLRGAAFSAFDFLTTFALLPVQYLLITYSYYLILHSPVFFVQAMAGIAFGSLIYMMYYVRTEKSTDFIYGIAYSFYSFFALQWIMPYAALTLRNRSWMTR